MTIDAAEIPERPGAPHRLGRHVHFDSRSLAYAAPVLPKTAVVSRRWPRRVPVFDQGALGSCTGNAAAGWVGTDDDIRLGLSIVGDEQVDEAFAVELYSAATKIDSYSGSYPPDDTGSDGLSAAKVLKKLGLAASYSHAFSLPALASALQSGPALIGVTWYNSAFTPNPDGGIPVDLSSGVAGGHELIVDELVVVDHGDHDRYWVTNSWGEGWGLDGRGFFTGRDLRVLLSDDGDVTVPKPVTAPAPPMPPADFDATLWAAAKTWAAAKGFTA